MFDFIKTTEKLPRGIKKFLKPRKEFVEQTKTSFLVVFDASRWMAGNGATATEANILGRPIRAHLGMLAKIFIACGAFAGVFIGVSVYADVANVAVNSPLYPLKRLSENVQLAVVPTEDKPQLQAVFAARRASEISKLETVDPSSTAISHLAQDLNTDINNSLTGAAAAGIEDGKLDQLCGKVLSAIATSSIVLHDQLAIRQRVLLRFENSCGEKGDNTMTATTTAAASPATSTVQGGAGNSTSAEEEFLTSFWEIKKVMTMPQQPALQ